MTREQTERIWFTLFAVVIVVSLVAVAIFSSGCVSMRAAEDLIEKEAKDVSAQIVWTGVNRLVDKNTPAALIIIGVVGMLGEKARRSIALCVYEGRKTRDEKKPLPKLDRDPLD